jgi:hypothetical protein
LIELGGNITLVGFKVLGEGELVVVKKMVGGYAQKFSDMESGFERLTITLKPIHKHEGGSGGKFELDARASVNGAPFVAEIVDRNLFVGLDSVMDKVFLMVEKHLEKQKDKDKFDKF